MELFIQEAGLSWRAAVPSPPAAGVGAAVMELRWRPDGVPPFRPAKCWAFPQTGLED